MVVSVPNFCRSDFAQIQLQNARFAHKLPESKSSMAPELREEVGDPVCDSASPLLIYDWLAFLRGVTGLLLHSRGASTHVLKRLCAKSSTELWICAKTTGI
jgi:hypothetical protein